jgi:hypothetical protein
LGEPSLQKLSLQGAHHPSNDLCETRQRCVLGEFNVTLQRYSSDRRLIRGGRIRERKKSKQRTEYRAVYRERLWVIAAATPFSGYGQRNFA